MKKHSGKTWVIIPAAGIGKRMQIDLPKQYLTLQGKTVIEHTLECFIHHPDIVGIVIALHPDDTYWQKLTLPTSVPIHTVTGGQERAHSVLNALTFLLEQMQWGQGNVLIHDAARPCLLRTDLDKLLGNKGQKAGSILAMPVRDTMKRGQQGHIEHTVDRQQLWHALTPQMFTVEVLYDALTSALREGVEITDEASAIEYIGLHPALIEGEATNIKITRPADLSLAEFFLQQRSSH